MSSLPEKFVIKVNKTHPYWDSYMEYLGRKSISGIYAYDYYGPGTNGYFATDRPNGLTIITLEDWKLATTFPEKWYIKCDNQEIINVVGDWMNINNERENNTFNYITDMSIGDNLNFPARNQSHAVCMLEVLGDYKEITLKQFKQQFMTGELLVKRGLLKKLYRASTCSDWTSRIGYYLRDTFLEDDEYDVRIKKEDVDFAIKNATNDQKDAIKSLGIILSEDLEFTPDVFITTTSNPFVKMEIRSIGEYAKKSLYLSSLYNWEIKVDEDGISCLIPTKK